MKKPVKPRKNLVASVRFDSGFYNSKRPFSKDIDLKTQDAIKENVRTLWKISIESRKTKLEKASFEKCIELIKKDYELRLQIMHTLKENNCDQFDISGMFDYGYVYGDAVRGYNCDKSNYNMLLKKYELDLLAYNNYLKEQEKQKKLAEKQKKESAEKKLLSELLQKYKEDSLAKCSDNAPTLDPKRKYI